MDKELLIEIITIFVGVTVIVIEAIIIFLLLRHIRIMKQSFEEIRLVVKEFRGGIDEHLEHMDDHSHKMEDAIERVYTQVCSIGSETKETP